MTSDLAARIEAAEAGEQREQRELLEEAWEECCRGSLSFRRFACTTIPGGDGWTMTGRFMRMIDAGAFTDAALMLVPEGLYPTIDFVAKRVWLRDARGFDVGGCAYGYAKTVPNSLAAAALRAKENDRG